MKQSIRKLFGYVIILCASISCCWLSSVKCSENTTGTFGSEYSTSRIDIPSEDHRGQESERRRGDHDDYNYDRRGGGYGRSGGYERRVDGYGRRDSGYDRRGGGWNPNYNRRESRWGFRDDRNYGQRRDENFEDAPYVPEERNLDELFHDTGIEKGLNFDEYENTDVKVDGKNAPEPINSFNEAEFVDLISDNLMRCRYGKPTPIQKYAIPIIMSGRDLIATAPTGSGKTAAFLLPIIHHLLSEKRELPSLKRTCFPKALIVTPTRELAVQIKDNARLYTSQTHIRVEILYGGTDIRYQSQRISRGCDILIATPGRLLDFVERYYVQFDSVKYVVLDEADRMLDMGFVRDIEKIMYHKSMSQTKQTLMFSATFSKEIRKLTEAFLNDYVFVSVGIIGSACKDIEQNFVLVEHIEEKKEQLIALLSEQQSLEGTLLFVEQKRMADNIAHFLDYKGFRTAYIHGGRSQNQRERALREFKQGRISILVATSVAARGLDMSGVTHVINFDLPKEIDDYVHRIGRTGRLGNKGKATSFYLSIRDKGLASNLIRILKEANQKVPDFLQNDAESLYKPRARSFDYRRQRRPRPYRRY